MISSQSLFIIAKSRYEEAKILLENDKPDGAVYLCGYALELMLKRCIIKNLQWDGYPSENKEFEDYKSFKVHNLSVLLRLSGLEKEIGADKDILIQWQIAKNWDSEVRYAETGRVSKAQAQIVLDASNDLFNHLLLKS